MAGGALEAKSSLEELVRVGASRAEDLRLVGELQGSLEARALAPALVRRLGVECALREEWRAQRALEALRDVSRLVDGWSEAACRELLEYCGARMQADAAFVADGLPRRAQPWQLALVAQTGSVAAAVRAAAAAPPPADADQGAGWLLGALRERVLDAPAAQLGQALALIDATARAVVGAPAPPIGAGPGAHAGSADGAAPPPRAAATPSAHDLDAYVRDRLRRQHEAQAASAALCVQRAVRPFLARRALAGARLARREARLGALRRAGVARRLAREVEWRWRYLLAVRCAAALRRAERAHAAREHVAARAAFVALAPSERGRWEAAARIQRGARGARARRRAAALRDGWPVRRLQAGARAWAALRARLWRVQLRALRAARADRAAWAEWRVQNGALAAELRTSLAVRMHVAAEVAAIDAELRREAARFESTFKTWEARMRKALLSRKLSSEWLPQLHPQTGEAYYFNMATGESRRQHPNMRLADLAVARERKSGEAQMEARFAMISEYKEGVVASAAAVREGCAGRIVALREEHARDWLGSCGGRSLPSAAAATQT